MKGQIFAAGDQQGPSGNKERGGLHAQVSVTSSADASSSGGESIALVVRDGLEVRLPMAGKAHGLLLRGVMIARQLCGILCMV